MSNLTDADREMARKIAAIALSEKAIKSLDDGDWTRLGAAARRLVTAALLASVGLSEDEMVEKMARTICAIEGEDPDGLDVLRLCDEQNQAIPVWRAWEPAANATLSAIQPDIARIVAERDRLRDLLERWCQSPEITEIAPEDRDPETEQTWRETRAALEKKP